MVLANKEDCLIVLSEKSSLNQKHLVDKKGNITYAFVDENYTRRAEPSDVLKELDKLV